MQTTGGVRSLWLFSEADTRTHVYVLKTGEIPVVPADGTTFQIRHTRVAVDIDSHSMEDLGATPFLLLFSGIKVELFVKLRDLGSHVATLEKRDGTHKTWDLKPRTWGIINNNINQSVMINNYYNYTTAELKQLTLWPLLSICIQWLMQTESSQWRSFLQWNLCRSWYKLMFSMMAIRWILTLWAQPLSSPALALFFDQPSRLMLSQLKPKIRFTIWQHILASKEIKGVPICCTCKFKIYLLHSNK